jgi:nicotinamide-nucleotide amidase
MNAEIVGVGTELLLGQIANTNAQEISRSLAAIGVDVYRHEVVGDNLDRMVQTLRAAASRADAVIVTGGLGPTPDDITREALAELAGVPLERDDELATQIKAIFDRFGRAMPPDNLRQADVPRGATPIPPEGTAPGLMLEHDGTLFFALPGVPWEMRAMMDTTVLPALKERGPGAVTVSQEIIVLGLGESRTHELISDIVQAQSQPTIAYRAGGGEVRLRLTAKAADEEAARRVIEPVEASLRERLGENAVEPGHDSVAEALGGLLKERGESVAVAESLTGGLVGNMLTKAEGASDFFAAALVCYSYEAKEHVLGVPHGIIETHGAVSAECAREMALGAARVANAALGLSTTGVAGPAEQEGKPPGTIFIGAAYRDKVEVREVRGYGDRDHVRKWAANSVLDLGRRVLLRA